LLLRAMNMAGETAERTLLVGDHVSDLQAAAAAGCRSVHLRSGRGAVPANPPPGYLGSFPDLLTLATAFPVGRVG